MSRTLELPDPIFDALDRAARADGTTPTGWIAARLADHRRGRTTIVMSASPLQLHHAERVVLLVDGRVGEQGTHAELLARSAAYRRVVVRSLDDDATVASTAGSGSEVDQ